MPLPQPVASGVHVDVDDRRDVEGQELGDQQAADHGQAQGAARLGALPGAQGDGQGAHQGGHGGHHDGAEPEEAALEDGLGRRLASRLRLQGEVDHHDGVLLHDADQHDDPDEGVDVQVVAEEQQA